MTETVTVGATATQIHQNPFCVLGASTRDDRRRILELADQRSLEIDDGVCEKARSQLTSPRQRLSAEIAWLPGISPRKAGELLSTLERAPLSLRRASGLPTLAHLNLAAAAFGSADEVMDSADIADFIIEISNLVERLDPADVARDINEDRAVSGFAEVRALDQVEAELAERKRHVRNCIRDALDRMPADKLVTAMTIAVETATSGGQAHAPELIDDLVDSYEVETKGFLDKEADNIARLVDAGLKAAHSGESAILPLIDKIEIVARNWDMAAQPIQLSAKARGLDHEPSRSVAFKIRSLAIELFNEHDLLNESERLTKLLLELFSEIPDVHDRVLQDDLALSEISQRRTEATQIEPVRDLCREVSKTIERRPEQANEAATKLLSEGIALLGAAPIKSTSPTYKDALDLIAATVMQCAIAYGNSTSKWKQCIALLQKAGQLASDSDLTERIRGNLEIVRSNDESLGDLEPIQSAPSLSTINGVGFKLYGSTGPKRDGSVMATYYFVVLFIPLFPICRYRVITDGTRYNFLGKGPLRDFDKWHLAISIGLICLLIFAMN
jgi:hypothetical protein